MKAKQMENEKYPPDLVESLRLSPTEESGGHLTDAEFVGYLMIDEHLATCQECAEEMRRMIEAAEAWRFSDLESKRLTLLEQIRTHAERSMVEPEIHLRSRTEERQISHETGSVEIRQDRGRPRPSNARDIVVALDIGSSKVGVLIGQRDDKGSIEVIGKGLAPNRGTRRGNIVNVEATVEAIKAASEEAEVMAGVEISRAYVGIAGADVRSVNSRGMVTVARKDREITRQDIQRVLDVAKSGDLPSDREILHAVPQEFIVDEQGGIDDPLGMLGTRMEVMTHLVTGNITRSRTLLTCVNRAGIEVVEMVFEPLAAAEAVLTHDEREIGVLLIDIGAGTTEYAHFAEGEIQYSGVAPIGAGHFTNDLAMVLRTPFAEAERIKVKQGCCLPSMVTEEEGIAVPTVAGGALRIIPKREICEILQPRAEEMLNMLRDDLRKNALAEVLRGGVVLTGGGAQLDGLLEMAEQIFDTSVRYGRPRGLSGLADVISSPSWATASGLLLYAQGAEENQVKVQKMSGIRVRTVMGSLRGIFADLF